MSAAPIVLQAKAKHTATVILAHGLGDSGYGWDFVQDALGNPAWIKFVLPNAPIQPVTVNGGMRMPSWYDIRELGSDSIDRASQDEAGMLRSAKTLTDLVTQEVDAGIPANRIVLAGFSQGSVISLLAGLTTERKMAGIAVLSGYLPIHQKIAQMATDHARKIPLFWGHGEADPVIPVKWAHESMKVINSRLKMTDVIFKTCFSDHPEEYEQRQVHEVYENIAGHFSDTRYKPWPTIERFLSHLAPGGLGLDSGCGNGKYLGLSSALRGGPVLLTGLDRSRELVKIGAAHGHEVLVGDALDLPYREGSFDFAISIAVVHHFASPDRRLKAIESLLRVLRPGGRLLVQVWAMEQGSETALSRRGENVQEEQDVLVPWKRRDGAPQEARYYHLFQKGELANLIRRAGGLEGEETWVRGNWAVEARRAW